MAQQVGYWDNNVTATEGPFVMVYIFGYRIEVEEGGECPHLPDTSIYDMLREAGIKYQKSEDRARTAAAVDWLNAQVKAGKIVRNLTGTYVRNTA